MEESDLRIFTTQTMMCGMLSNTELLDKCRSNQPITCEDLGLTEWRNHTDGTVYICGGYTIYKTPDGYRHESGKFVTPFQRILYGLE